MGKCDQENTKAPLCLNIGCGPSGLKKGWLNYDWGILPFLSKFKRMRRLIVGLGLLSGEYQVNWPPIKLVDIRRRFPLKDGTVQFIYCSHILEHFDRWQALKILKECRRVLRKGGVIRIVIPDIEKMYQIYQQTAKRAGRKLCRLWWGFNKDGQPGSIILRWERVFIRGHQWNYDRKELKILLQEAGFSKMKKVGFQQGKVPDLKKLDLKIHKDHSLYLEATKR